MALHIWLCTLLSPHFSSQSISDTERYFRHMKASLSLLNLFHVIIGSAQGERWSKHALMFQIHNLRPYGQLPWQKIKCRSFCSHSKRQWCNCLIQFSRKRNKSKWKHAMHDLLQMWLGGVWVCLFLRPVFLVRLHNVLMLLIWMGFTLQISSATQHKRLNL